MLNFNTHNELRCGVYKGGFLHVQGIQARLSDETAILPIFICFQGVFPRQNFKKPLILMAKRIVLDFCVVKIAKKQPSMTISAFEGDDTKLLFAFQINWATKYNQYSM